MRQVDRHVVAATLGAWAASVRTALPPTADEPEAIASEGKPLRGSHPQGVSAALGAQAPLGADPEQPISL